MGRDMLSSLQKNIAIDKGKAPLCGGPGDMGCAKHDLRDSPFRLPPFDLGLLEGYKLLGKVTCDNTLSSWTYTLESQTLIGSFYGIRPHTEVLKQWMQASWGSWNIPLPLVQYLPNNYYFFFFNHPKHAYVIRQGTWLMRHTPFVFTRWYKEFNPRTDMPRKVPVWVDMPGLPLLFHKIIKELGAELGTVL